MLLLPVDRNVDWRNPPIVTLCLVLVKFVSWYSCFGKAGTISG
jgi:hypothetical protein